MNVPEVIDALLTEQQQLMAMKLQDVAAASGAERQSLFDDYRRFLAAHQGAEQVWMYGGRGPAPTTKAADIQMDGQKKVEHSGVADCRVGPVRTEKVNPLRNGQ